MRSQSRLPDSARHLLLYSLLLSCMHAAAAQTPHPAFAVASVKPAPPGADPNRGSWSIPGIGPLTATHVSLALLIELAYDDDNSQVANKPNWLDNNLYDIAAKAEDDTCHSRRAQATPAGSAAAALPSGSPH